MFHIEFLLLPLIGYDALLGIQWLKQMLPILCDFQNLTMELNIGGKEVCFQRSHGSSLKASLGSLNYLLQLSEDQTTCVLELELIISKV